MLYVVTSSGPSGEYAEIFYGTGSKWSALAQLVDCLTRYLKNSNMIPDCLNELEIWERNLNFQGWDRCRIQTNPENTHISCTIIRDCDKKVISEFTVT